MTKANPAVRRAAALRNPKRHAWNGTNRTPPAPPAPACVHHFVIPGPPEPPLGICRHCGEKRLHTNFEERDTSPWRVAHLKKRNREAEGFRLPTGWHLDGIRSER